MPHFTRPLTVTKLSKRHWKVELPFSFVRSEEDIISVPNGFITDFASVPQIFWSLVPPDGRYTQAAVLHDYLCISPNGRKQRHIDSIFDEAMKISGVRLWRRIIMITSVRAYQMFKHGLAY